MKATVALLSLPLVAALAMAPTPSRPPVPQETVPQEPQAPTAARPDEHSVVVSLSELQYTDLQGKTTVVPARNIVEIRMLDDNDQRVRLELTYDNGDYSLLDTQALHLLRNGTTTREVRLVRCHTGAMRFPRLP